MAGDKFNEDLCKEKHQGLNEKIDEIHKTLSHFRKALEGVNTKLVFILIFLAAQFGAEDLIQAALAGMFK